MKNRDRQPQTNRTEAAIHYVKNIIFTKIKYEATILQLLKCTKTKNIFHTADKNGILAV